jgi:hypothetical protein
VRGRRGLPWEVMVTRPLFATVWMRLRSAGDKFDACVSHAKREMMETAVKRNANIVERFERVTRRGSWRGIP